MRAPGKSVPKPVSLLSSRGRAGQVHKPEDTGSCTCRCVLCAHLTLCLTPTLTARALAATLTAGQRLTGYACSTAEQQSCGVRRGSVQAAEG